LFKAVLLAQWNGLSDEAMEEMLADRLSFQNFCGLGLADPKPDHSTLRRFREALAESGLADGLFKEINRQLGDHGFFLCQGTVKRERKSEQIDKMSDKRLVRWWHGIVAEL
jgi:IS5 family transposase